MRRISILSAALAISVWAGTGWAADPGYGVYRTGWLPTAGMAASYGIPAQGGGCAACGTSGQTGGCADCGTSGACGGCDECGDSSACCGRHRCCGPACQYTRHVADVGYFNCRCRGSYKYPVPPQYTYFWPGMYSQKTMTEYNSPYRFPPLKSPDEAFRQDEDDLETPESGMSPFVPEAPTTSPAAPSGPRRPATTYESPGGKTPPSLEPGKLPGLDPANVIPRQPLPSQRLKKLYGIP